MLTFLEKLDQKIENYNFDTRYKIRGTIYIGIVIATIILWIFNLDNNIDNILFGLIVFLMLGMSYFTWIDIKKLKKEQETLHKKDILDFQKEMIKRLADIIEFKDDDTGYHTTRVAEYSELLATKYELSEKEVAFLKLASPMHDIGKVAIPDKLLKENITFVKDPPDEDWIIMQTHAEKGFDLLKNSKKDIIKIAATIAHEHHEKWDGTGYPRGLKGEEISVYARITALADVYDALSCKRPYKKAWNHEEIIELLKEERGKQFEPKLVDIFFENLDEILKIRNSYTEKE